VFFKTGNGEDVVKMVASKSCLSVFAWLLLLSFAAAQQIEPSPAQLATLKTDITNDVSQVFVDFKADPGNISKAQAVADAYNASASPDFWVWRSSVTKHELVNSESVDADGVSPRSFIWAGNGFISRTQGEIEAWREIFNSTLTVNPSLANVRAAFQDIFSGTGNAASNRIHLANIARRKATRVETLFATGTGTAASPGTMGAEGRLIFNSVQAAWFSP
jgi:hypothetical protein